MSRMKKGVWIRRYAFLLCLCCVCLTGKTQNYAVSTEIGVYGGGSYYIGDLNPSQHFIYSKPAFGLIYRYNLSTRHSLRATAFYGNVYGNDSDASDPAQLNRNLSFKSNILEIIL